MRADLGRARVYDVAVESPLDGRGLSARPATDVC